MPSPQLENGYTRISNDIMDALARTRIPGEARQVLDFIIRKTYGFGKKEDWISLSQFCAATGMRKVSVCKAIRKLVEMNIITKKGNGTGADYGLVKDYGTWKPLPKKVTVTKKGNQHYPKSYPQKKLLQKKESPRKFSDEDMFIAKRMYEKILEVAPSSKKPNFEKWADTIRLMRERDKIPVVEIKRVFTWANSDGFWKVNILSPAKFREKFASLQAKMMGHIQQGGTDPNEPPVRLPR